VSPNHHYYKYSYQLFSKYTIIINNKKINLDFMKERKKEREKERKKEREKERKRERKKEREKERKKGASSNL